MKRKVKVVFYTYRNKVPFIFLGHRKSGGEAFWWIPGGSMEGNENAFEALSRELQEEIKPGKAFLAGIRRAGKNPKSLERISFVSGITDYQVFFVEIPDEVLEEEVEIMEEFDNVGWFPTGKLPGNLSREFEYIATKVRGLEKDRTRFET
jgi:8-oxo-dGTP pyrophosphatase MutT (NUDIX family)